MHQTGLNPSNLERRAGGSQMPSHLSCDKSQKGAATNYADASGSCLSPRLSSWTGPPEDTQPSTLSRVSFIFELRLRPEVVRIAVTVICGLRVRRMTDVSPPLENPSCHRLGHGVPPHTRTRLLRRTPMFKFSPGRKPRISTARAQSVEALKISWSPHSPNQP